MSFLVAAALAVGLLVVVPIVAHLLRRGRVKERDFPPAELVPATRAIARKTSRLEDRSLLSLRALLILALAALGAVPLVQCSRLSLSRNAGASIALAIVIDDSLSMRATAASDRTRWEQALGGARDLLSSAREGDAIALVLAGRPARLALAATTDLRAARRALDDLKPSDRPTDLQSAVKMARSSLKQLQHVDKRVAVLSDLAGDPLEKGTPPLWTPLKDLERLMNDCGIVSAERRGRSVTVNVACSSSDAAKDRSVELLVADKGAREPVDGSTDAQADVTVKREGSVDSASLSPRAGVQSLSLELDAAIIGLDARLTGKDDIERDDGAPVAAQQSGLLVGVLSDPAQASVVTGGPTIVEQALAALTREIMPRPLTILPDDEKELGSFAVMVLDDPAGLTPEMRSALQAFVKRGGVVLALLGRRAQSAQLGSSLEPFAQGAVPWSETHASGVDVASAAWLGPEAQSLSELNPKGRASLQGAELTGSRVVARWQDGETFMTEQTLGRGLVLVAGLPSSPHESDFAIRPAFIALLDYVMDQAERRTGPRRSVAGSIWTFAANSKVTARGPQGELVLQDVAGGRDEDETKALLADLVGRYEIDVDGQQQTRIVTLDPSEITTRPIPSEEQAGAKAEFAAQTNVDVSSELAMLILLLFSAEIALRVFGHLRATFGRS